MDAKPIHTNIRNLEGIAAVKRGADKTLTIP